MTPEEARAAHAELQARVTAAIEGWDAEDRAAWEARPPTKRDQRKERKARGLKAMAEREVKHPRAETWMGYGRDQCAGPQWAWDDLISHWWTAAEWLARWRRLPAHLRRYRRCPPRPWINPARTTLRGGLRTRKLP